ncbi:MAG: lipopolysaccharide heptosyltransferase II [Acidobacteria bacterium]|nr:lipopolysaccharide heptosyltransferase II [Acidobacteriota bacterium]
MLGETSAVKRIFIRGTNWVGDAVISIPAMLEVRRLFPQAHISLLVRPWVRDIYSAVDFVDEVLEYDRDGRHRGWTGLLRLAADIKKRRYDLAILLQNAFEAALIAWLARIPRRIGYARDGRSLLLTDAVAIDPEVRTVHQAYYYLGILSGMGMLDPRPWRSNEFPPGVRIGVRDADRSAAGEILRSHGIRESEVIVGINPGAFYGEAKRWFPDRYAAVADALAGRFNARILLFGAQSDLRAAEEVAASMKQPRVILAGRTTLGQLMGLIRECTLLITNDSGPMHLAAALDVPQLAIFGSTSEVATGPLSRKAVVIKHPVECNPCFLRKCPADFRCMKEISVREVLEAAQKLLEEHGRGQM